MKILYIHQYFNTPRSQGGLRSYEFSKHLIGKNHSVTMITSGLHNPEHPVRKNNLFNQYDADGFKVIAIRAGYNDARYGTGLSGYRRMIVFLNFAKMATQICKQLPKPDIVFATHTPLTVGLTGIDLKKHFGIPFVFEVRDLWPEALVNIGALRNPMAIYWLKKMSRKIYRGADHITAASPGMKQGVLNYGISNKKVTVITQGCDLSIFNPANRGNGTRQRLGIGERFAAIYFGAMGHANGLDYVIQAAEILKQRGRKEILIILHGDGGKKEALKALALNKKVNNVIFSDPVPDKKDLADIVAACDACLTIYKATKEKSWSPNKMFDSLAAGRPVIINVPGWLGKTIEDNECGILTDPENPATLADALIKLADSSDLCRRYGIEARNLAERQFSRARMGARLERIFLEAVNGNSC